MKNHDIYLYGVITQTNGFLLKYDFPKADSICEIKEQYTLPGGETGMAAIVLDALDCKVKIDGNHLGKRTKDMLNDFYGKTNIDISALHYAPDHEGLEDFVMIDGSTRTIFSTFAPYYDLWERGILRWNNPAEADIRSAKVAAIDPWYDKQSLIAAEYCRKNSIPYVTIDEKPENEIAKHASIIVTSGEYIRSHISDYYTPDNEKEGKIALIKKYAEHTGALVIITGGSNTIYYGRGGEIRESDVYKVDVVSTLCAGDTFKAGCVYSLLHGYDDDKIVRFASALAAVACTKFPLALNPPKLDEVVRLMESQHR
jgi:sugar/nucleoside kinase (ribokinase family)